MSKFCSKEHGGTIGICCGSPEPQALVSQRDDNHERHGSPSSPCSFEIIEPAGNTDADAHIKHMAGSLNETKQKHSGNYSIDMLLSCSELSKPSKSDAMIQSLTERIDVMESRRVLLGALENSLPVADAERFISPDSVVPRLMNIESQMDSLNRGFLRLTSTFSGLIEELKKSETLRRVEQQTSHETAATTAIQVGPNHVRQSLATCCDFSMTENSGKEMNSERKDLTAVHTNSPQVADTAAGRSEAVAAPTESAYLKFQAANKEIEEKQRAERMRIEANREMDYPRHTLAAGFGPYPRTTGSSNWSIPSSNGYAQYQQKKENFSAEPMQRERRINDGPRSGMGTRHLTSDPTANNYENGACYAGSPPQWYVPIVPTAAGRYPYGNYGSSMLKRSGDERSHGLPLDTPQVRLQPAPSGSDFLSRDGLLQSELQYMKNSRHVRQYFLEVDPKAEFSEPRPMSKLYRICEAPSRTLIICYSDQAARNISMIVNGVLFGNRAGNYSEALGGCKVGLNLITTPSKIVPNVDGPGFDYVVNYNVPEDRSVYLDRVAFALTHCGNVPHLICFGTKEDWQFFADIADRYGTKITKMVDVTDLFPKQLKAPAQRSPDYFQKPF